MKQVQSTHVSPWARLLSMADMLVALEEREASGVNFKKFVGLLGKLRRVTSKKPTYITGDCSV